MAIGPISPALPMDPLRPLCLRLPARPSTGRQRLALGKGEALRLGLDAATALGCDAGRLWLTVDGDPQDYVLERGEALLLQDLRPLHVVVALADAALWLWPLADLPFKPEPWTRRAPRTLRTWWRSLP